MNYSNPNTNPFSQAGYPQGGGYGYPTPPDPLQYFGNLPKFPEYRHFPPELLETLDYIAMIKPKQYGIAKEKYMRADLELGYPIMLWGEKYLWKAEMTYILDMYNLLYGDFAHLKEKEEFLYLLTYMLNEEEKKEIKEKYWTNFMEGSYKDLTYTNPETIDRIKKIAKWEYEGRYRLGGAYMIDRDEFLRKMFKESKYKWLMEENQEGKMRNEDGHLQLHQRTFFEITDTLINRFRMKSNDKVSKMEIVVFDNRESERRKRKGIEDPYNANMDRLSNSLSITREVLYMKITPFIGSVYSGNDDIKARPEKEFFEKKYPFDKMGAISYVDNTYYSGLIIEVKHNSEKWVSRETLIARNAWDTHPKLLWNNSLIPRKHFLPNLPELDKYFIGMIYMLAESFKNPTYWQLIWKDKLLIDLEQIRKKSWKTANP